MYGIPFDIYYIAANALRVANKALAVPRLAVGLYEVKKNFE